MTTIYKYKVTNGCFKAVVPEAVVIPNEDPSLPSEIDQPDIPEVTLYLNVTEQLFEVRARYEEVIYVPDAEGNITYGTQTKDLYWVKLSLDTLKSKISLADQSLWSVHIDDLYTTTDHDSPTDITAFQVFDVFGNAIDTKGQYSDINKNEIFQVFVPFVEGATMLDFDIRLTIDETVYNGKSISYKVDPASPSKNLLVDQSKRPSEFVAPITATGPATISANSSAVVNVSTLPGISAVYLEQVHGILPQVKIPLTNGQGSFTVLTLGMVAGDEVQVKLGFKKWINGTMYKKVIS